MKTTLSRKKQLVFFTCAPKGNQHQRQSTRSSGEFDTRRCLFLSKEVSKQNTSPSELEMQFLICQWAVLQVMATSQRINFTAIESSLSFRYMAQSRTEDMQRGRYNQQQSRSWCPLWIPFGILGVDGLGQHHVCICLGGLNCYAKWDRCCDWHYGPHDQQRTLLPQCYGWQEGGKKFGGDWKGVDPSTGILKQGLFLVDVIQVSKTKARLTQIRLTKTHVSFWLGAALNIPVKTYVGICAPYWRPEKTSETALPVNKEVLNIHL